MAGAFRFLPILFGWPACGALAGGCALLTELYPSDGGVHELGAACALHKGTAFIGAWGDDGVSANAGSGYLYSVPDGAELGEIHPPYPSWTGPGYFGDSVAINDDRLLAGAPSYVGAGLVQSGGAFLYSRDGVLQHEFRAALPEGGGRYGDSVSLSGPYTVIGGSRQEVAGRPLDAGLVDVYDSVSGNRLRTLIPENTAIKGFGASLATHGNLAAIGTDLVYSDQGALTSSAFLFDIETGEQLAELPRPSLSSTFGGYGSAVALWGDTLLVAHRLDDQPEPNAGAVYVYDVSTPRSPVLRGRLVAGDAARNWLFGTSVALNGQRAAIGAEGRDESRGAAYVFDLVNLREMCVLTAPEGDGPNPVQHVGSSVAIEGGTIVVGARSYRSGVDTGAAFVFDAPDGLACSRVDLAPPIGLLDLADINAFVEGFVSQGPIADIFPDGLYDLADITAFVASFVAGCP